MDRYDKATHSANNLRTQIKDYLSEASNAKLMYDDEVKQTAELVKEVQTLRAHVTKLAADGANGSANEEALRKELDSAKGDAEIVRRQLKEQLDQNRSLLDRSASQSERLSKMEAENQRLASLLQTASAKLEELVKMPRPVHTDEDYEILQKKYEELEESNVQLEIELEEANRKNEEFSSLPSYSDEYLTQDITDSSDDLSYLNESSDVADTSSDYDFSDSSFSQDYTEPKSSFSFVNEETEEPKSTFSLSEDNASPVANDDLGVEKGFKTFTQLMNEDRKERDHAQKQTYVDDDDDGLPNLSWINDI